MLIVVLMSIFAPLIAPYDPREIVNDRRLSPSSEHIMGPMYSRTWDPAKSKERRARSIYAPDASNVWHGRFVNDYDVTNQLASITAPTLLLGARHDWICAPEFSELIVSRVPNADLRIFENSGHLVTADERQAFLDVVRGFLPYNLN